MLACLLRAYPIFFQAAHHSRLLGQQTIKRKTPSETLSVMEEKTVKKSSIVDRQTQEAKMGDTRRKPSHQEVLSTRGTETEDTTDRSKEDKQENEHTSPLLSNEDTRLSCGKEEDDCITRCDVETPDTSDNKNCPRVQLPKDAVGQNVSSTFVQKEEKKDNVCASNETMTVSTGRNPISMVDGDPEEMHLASNDKEKPRGQQKAETDPRQGQHACKYAASLKNKALIKEKMQLGKDNSRQGEKPQPQSQTLIQGSTKDEDRKSRYLSKAEKIERMLRERAPSNLPREWMDNIPNIAKQLDKKIGAYEEDGAILQKLREMAMYVNSHPRRRKRKRCESTIVVQPKARLPQQIQPQQNWCDKEEQASSPQEKKAKPPDLLESSPSTAQLSTVRQRVCLHQQQRLLLLRHAYACPYGDGSCPKTEHCGAMKRLWKHIVDCKNRECLVPHCVSSRYVLSHYYKCRDTGCNVCVPVKDVIRRGSDTFLPKEQGDVKSKAAGEGEMWPLISMGNIKVKITLGKQNCLERRTQPPLKVPRLLADSEPKLTMSPVEREDNNISIKKETKINKKFLAQSEQHAKLVAHIEPISVQALPKAEKNQVEEKGIIRSKESADSGDEHEVVVESKEQALDPSLMDWTEIEPVEVHIATLNNELQLGPHESKTCREVLKKLRSDANCWLFDTPIDPIALNLADYFKVISHPMDLGTVEKRLDLGLYQDTEEFQADVHLTFDNAMLYNEEGSKIHDIAKELKNKFMTNYERGAKLGNDEEDAHDGDGLIPPTQDASFP